MMDDPDKRKVRIKWIKRIGLTMAGLFLIYTIVGFWVVPPLLKPRLEEQLSGLLGRKVTIDSIKMNPLLLTSTTSNLTVYETDGEPFAGFQELFVNAQLSSIFNWAFTVREIRIQAPFGVLKLLPNNQLNINDILAKLSEPEPEPKEDTGLPRAIVEKVDVIDGKATFSDLTGTEPIGETFSPITFTLEKLSTLKDRQGSYQVAGAGPIGGQFELNGEVTVNPVRIQGSFSIKDTQLNRIWEHIEDQVSFQIQKGSMAVSGEFTVAIIDGKIEANLNSGAFGLADFELVEKSKEEVLIAVPTLSVQGVSADVKTREIVVDRIETADAAIKSWFSADGSVELQRLFQPDIEKLVALKASSSPEPETSESPPWHATVKAIDVKDWALILDDQTGEDPIRETFAIDTFTVENLSTQKDLQGSYTFVGTGPSGGSYQLNGKLTVDPIWVQGDYSMADADLAHFWEHIKEYASFQVKKGLMGASGNYTLAFNAGAFSAKLENGGYELNQFELVEKGKKEVLVSLPAFAVQGIRADLQTREIDVKHIQTADAAILSWLEKDGSIGLLDLFLADLEKLQKKKPADESEPEKDPGQPWQLTLQKMEVNDWGMVFEDRTLTQPATLSVDNINVALEDFSNEKGSQAKANITMQLNRAGNVKVTGALGIDPIQADLKVVTDKIALKPYQPYVDDAVNAQIISGSTSSKGRVRYRGKKGKPQILYEGEVSVDGVEIQDTAQTEDFFTLAQFKTSGIALALLPNELNASTVLIDQPHARVTIDENGLINVVNAFAPKEKKEGEGEGEKNLLQRLVDLLILQFKGPMPLKVDRVQLNKFTGDFVDASISPAYSTHVEFTEGVVEGLSSDPSARADFKIEGSIDQTATIKGTGQMNPMNALNYSKVDVSLKGFGLPPVSPYSGKFIGFKINKGTLHTDLKYMVDNDKVDGNNIILIDHLELGEKVDSPDAPNLPIKLGVALLKDANDRITVQVPVKGDVRDPQFDFGKAIESALTGTIEGAGGAPFSAITEIDGFSGDQLRTIAFEFGFSALQENEIKKMNALAKFLNEKKTLTLEIMGTADRQMDWAAIAGESSKESPTDGEKADEKETKMDPAAGQEIDDALLEKLARRRAEKVSAYLVEEANVDAKRIDLKPLQIKPAADVEGGSVELFLSIE